MGAHRKPFTVDDPRHGTSNGYTNLGCHCPPCTAAWAKAHVAYMDRHPEQREKARLYMVTYNQVLKVRKAAAKVFTAEGVNLWMDTPNPSLNNATPTQFIKAGDTDRVLQILAGLADGVM